MKLTTTRPSQLTPRHDARNAAIMNKYGDTTAMHARWAFTYADYIADNLDRAADVPALVMMRHTYGNEAIAAVLESHLGAALQAMGVSGKFAAGDARLCADAILASEDAQLLNFARVLAFFVWLKRGGYDLHGYTNFQLMRAFKTYAATALQEQRRIESQRDREIEREKWERDRANAMTFEQYCAATGYDGENPLKV